MCPPYSQSIEGRSRGGPLTSYGRRYPKPWFCFLRTIADRTGNVEALGVVPLNQDPFCLEGGGRGGGIPIFAAIIVQGPYT